MKGQFLSQHCLLHVNCENLAKTLLRQNYIFWNELFITLNMEKFYFSDKLCKDIHQAQGFEYLKNKN